MNELQRKYIMEPEGDDCFIHNELLDELIGCQVSSLHFKVMLCIAHMTVCKGAAQVKATSRDIAEQIEYKSDIANIRKKLAGLIARKILIKDENGIGFNFKFSEWDKKKK